VSLQCADHNILHTEVTRGIGGRQPRHLLLPLDDEFESSLPNGAKMGATRNDRHLMSRRSELNCEITADRARAKNADFH
jgi:hypothetical protein